MALARLPASARPDGRALNGMNTYIYYMYMYMYMYMYITYYLDKHAIQKRIQKVHST